MTTTQNIQTYVSGDYSSEQIQAIAEEIHHEENVQYYAENLNDWELMYDVLNQKTKKQLLAIKPDIVDYEGNNWTKDEGIKHILSCYNMRSLKDIVAAPAADETTTNNKEENKMKKLNKTQIWSNTEYLLNKMVEKVEIKEEAGVIDVEIVMDIIKEAVSDFEGFLKPKTGGGKSGKVNEEGEVYCNYFGHYMPAASFDTKLSKLDVGGNRKTVYKANCKTAEAILRKIKNLKTSVNNMAVSAFTAKRISQDEMIDILNKLDTAVVTKYETADEVPTAAVVVGLTDA